jgi:hypothetical protein
MQITVLLKCDDDVHLAFPCEADSVESLGTLIVRAADHAREQRLASLLATPRQHPEPKPLRRVSRETRRKMSESAKRRWSPGEATTNPLNTRRGADYWEPLIAAYRAEGSGRISDFCRRNGLSTVAFGHWLRK